MALYFVGFYGLVLEGSVEREVKINVIWVGL
jgi:hypothetical protein